MRISTASFALAAMLAAPLLAPAPSALAVQDRSPEQDKALFEARKTWAKDSYRRRLGLLQSHQRCMEAATSSSALKDCRQQKKQARKSLKQDHRAYINQVREQIGLPVRSEKKRARKRRKLQA